MYASQPAQNPVAAARNASAVTRSENRADRLEPDGVREERRRQEPGAYHVREAGWPRVLERPLTDVRLHELEVRKAGEAVAPPEA